MSLNMIAPTMRMNWTTGRLDSPTHVGKKFVRELRGYWQDEQAALEQSDVLLYETEVWVPEASVVIDETPGVVLWGSTILQAGTVGDEFFMTRGHRHLKPSHGEMIFCVQGSGLLMLMDETGETTRHPLEQGATLWIDGRLAHRTVNTSDVPLIFWCAWPNDCGHDYDSIKARPFRPVLKSQFS